MPEKTHGFVEFAAIVLIALVVGFASILVTKKDDQFVEEFAENVVEQELGLPSGSIDLTPESKEK